MYIVYIIYSIHIRNNIITLCLSAHSIFQMGKNPHAAFYKYILLQMQLNASDKQSL